MIKRSGLDKTFNIANTILLLIISLLTILPLYYIVIISITSPTQYLLTKGKLLFPTQFSFDAYRLVLFSHAFKNSILVSSFLVVVGTALSLAVTTAFAYGISKRRLVGRKALIFITLFTFLFNPGIIPNYMIVRDFGLINSIWSLILPPLARCFYMLLMKCFFENIPAELEESAKIEGCSDVGVFFKIILPVSYAALATFGLFYAVNYWNNYFDAVLYINDPDKWPLPIFIRNLVILSSTADITELSDSLKSIPAEGIKMATVVLGTVPILVVYPFIQKYFATGVMMGSVKG